MFRLVRPSISCKEAAILYIDELVSSNSAIHGTGFLDKYLESSTYEDWLSEIRYLEFNNDSDIVSASTFFVMDDSDYIIGMVNIRHTLNDKLLFHGGNIGYSIRPSERGNGYAKVALYLALKECFSLGLDSVLITAEDNNIPSYRTIEALGGVLENKVLDDGKYFRRYWINVSDSLSRFSF